MSKIAHRDAFDKEREVNHFPCHTRGCQHPFHVMAEEYRPRQLDEMANADCRFLDPETHIMIDEESESRSELRKRIAAYEESIRSDQMQNVPSQIGVVIPVPQEVGGYSDAELEKIRELENEVRAGAKDLTLEESLEKALNRFNLLPKQRN